VRTLKKWSSRWQKQLEEADLPPALKEIVQEKAAKSTEDRPDPSLPEPVRPLNAQEPVQHPHQQNRRPPQQHQGRSRAQGPGENRHGKPQRQRLERLPANAQNAGPDVSELLKQ